MLAYIRKATHAAASKVALATGDTFHKGAVCSVCGSDDLTVMHWLHTKTGAVSDEPCLDSEAWCERCGDHVMPEAA